MVFNINLKKDFDIKISSHIIKVRFVGDDHPALQDQDSTNTAEDRIACHGVYIADEMTIFIKASDPHSMKLSTYLHEIVHVFEHIYTFEIDHMLLNLIAEAFAQVLIDNHSKK